MRTTWTVEKDALVFDHFDYLIDDMTEIVWRDLNAERLNFGHTASAMHTVVTKAAPDIEDINDRAEEWAKANAGKLVTHISAEQRKAIQRITTRALQHGLSDAEAAIMVKKAIGLTPQWVEAVENFRQGLIAKGAAPGDARRKANTYADRLRMTRARQIAATELQSALNMGQLLSWEDAVKDGELPTTVQRKFVVHKDERLCEKCRPLHGQVIGIGQNWKVKKQTFLTPPIHPNCRCTEVLVGKSLRGRRKAEDKDDKNKNQQVPRPPRPPIDKPAKRFAAGALKVGQRVHLADAPETDPDGTVTTVTEGDRIRVRWDDGVVSWHVPEQLIPPTGKWDPTATPEQIEKHGTKGRPGYKLLHPGGSEATGKRATALNVWQGTFDACDRIQDNAECILARKPTVDHSELTGRKWSTMRAPEAAQVILDSLYEDGLPQADYGMITANPQKYAANPVKYRGNLWRGMRFTTGERDQFLEDARRGAPMLVSLASFSLDRSVAENYSNDYGVVIQVENEETPILPTPDFPTQDVVTTGRFVPVEVTEGNPSVVRMQWEGMVASLSKDDIEFSKWSRHFAKPQIEVVDKHGTKGRPGYRLLHPNTGYGRGVNFDVDRFVQDNPRNKGELLFEWHSRICAVLDPDNKNWVIFKLRERYEPVDFLAKGAARWRREQGLPEPKVDISEVMADIEKGDKVGRFYENTPDQSNDPEVIAAYEDFKRQNEEMYDFITRPESEGGLGITVEIVKDPDGEPYDNAEQQAEDLRQNRHFAVQTGLGGNHPLMTTAEYDRFRAVHDIFGHSAIGRGFDRHGEYEAWLSHVSMYQRPGRDAMSSEYHAVNSALWSGDPNNPGGTGKAILLPLELMDPFDAKGNLIRKAKKWDDDEIDYFIETVGLTTKFVIEAERNAWHTERERIIKHGNKGEPGYELLHPGIKRARILSSPLEGVHPRFLANQYARLDELGITEDQIDASLEEYFARGDMADGEWYYDKHIWAAELATKYDTTIDRVAAMTAAISPMRQWPWNQRAVETMLDVLTRENETFTITQEEVDTYNKKKPKHFPAMKAGTYRMDDPTLTTRFLVAGHPELANTMSTTGIDDPVRAVNIFKGADIDKELSGPKIRSFYNNILEPDAPHVTIDSKMFRILYGNNKIRWPYKGKVYNYTVAEAEAAGRSINSFFHGGGMKQGGKQIVPSGTGLYPIHAAAVARVARRHGLPPSVFQAIVWSVNLREGKAQTKAKRKRTVLGRKKKNQTKVAT